MVYRRHVEARCHFIARKLLFGFDPSWELNSDRRTERGRVAASQLSYSGMLS